MPRVVECVLFHFRGLCNNNCNDALDVGVVGVANNWMVEIARVAAISRFVEYVCCCWRARRSRHCVFTRTPHLEHLCFAFWRRRAVRLFWVTLTAAVEDVVCFANVWVYIHVYFIYNLVYSRRQHTNTIKPQTTKRYSITQSASHSFCLCHANCI